MKKISNNPSPYYSENRNVPVHGSILSTGAVVVVVLAVVAAAIGSSSWAYKAYKERRARKNSLKKNRDGLLHNFMDNSNAGSLRSIISIDRNSTGTYGSLRDKRDESPSSESNKTKHLASPIDENDQTSMIWEGNLGCLEYSASYDHQEQVLSVTIISCSDLPSKDPQLGTSDPYVKLQLLPEKKLRVKTQIQRKTLNPIFNETFRFNGITLNQIKSMSLHFVVLSFDRFSRDDIIGEVVSSLSELDLNMASEVLITKDIQPRRFKTNNQNRGEILLSICHQPAAKMLTVVILKARNLPKTDATGLAGDPYIKLYLTQNGQRIAKKKTHVKKRTLNPVFNQSFSFDLMENENLDSVGLELLVMEYDRVSKNEIIGCLSIGKRIGEREEMHWNEVLNNPRKQVAEWHKLNEP